MVFQPEASVSTQKAFTESLLKLGGKYKNFVVLNANVSTMLGLESFERIFPDRCFQFGNAVSTMLSAAVGFAAKGKIPFVCAQAAIISSKNWQALRSFAAGSHLNIKIVGIQAGLLNSNDGLPQQATEDIALMRAISGMQITCPADAHETRKTVEVMLQDYNPTYLRLYHLPFPDLYNQDYAFTFGKGFIYKSGTDVCIFATGIMVHLALEAANLLERANISTMVVTMPSIAPLDSNLIIECAKSVTHLVTVEDHHINGGLGSAVAEVLTTHYPTKVLRIGMEGLSESGKLNEVYNKYGLDGGSIAQRVQDWVRKL